MNRKSIIQIVVVVICFGASAMVLYKGFFKEEAVTAPFSMGGALGTQPGATAAAEASNPLPYGDDLSGELKKALNRNGLRYDYYSYPKLNPSEVGIPVTDLVRPSPSDKDN